MAKLHYLQEARQRHTKTYTSGPLVLNKSHKFFHGLRCDNWRGKTTCIHLGRMNSSWHQYRTSILSTVNHEMPWYILVWVPESDIYLCQETLYRSESCKRKLRKTLACGPLGMANQVHQACHRRYWYYAIACRSTWLLSSALSPPFLPQFHYRDAK